MPDTVTKVTHDVKSEVQLSIGSLGKLKTGDLEVKTDVVAQDLFSKYPNVDRLLISQMMGATYCSLIQNLSEQEKVLHWEKFNNQIMRFMLQLPPLPQKEKPSNVAKKAGAPKLVAADNANASVGCGSIRPDLYLMVSNEWGNDTKNGDNNTAFVDLTPGKQSDFHAEDNFGAGQGKAIDDFGVRCAVLRAAPDSATTLLTALGNVHAFCGRVSGTGFQPGGGGGIYPTWRSDIKLPGSAADRWSLNVLLRNDLKEINPGEVNCSVTLDAFHKGEVVAVNATKAFQFPDLPSGNHVLELTCSGPGDGFPWHRAYESCLGPRGIDRSSPVSLAVEVIGVKKKGLGTRRSSTHHRPTNGGSI